MKKYLNPNKSDWSVLCQRPSSDTSAIEKVVRPIMERVKKDGDKALEYYSQHFDGVELKTFQISQNEIREAVRMTSSALKNAILVAKNNIEKFHENQRVPLLELETTQGVKCFRKSVPIQKIGLYIPGGTAPLFSTLLMLGVPAKLAGCEEIIICTPPDKKGKIHPYILFTAQLLGIEKIFKVGGAQAIAAMTFGTESIMKVSKIFGPGNQYVTVAKQLSQQTGVGIDMPAGPSEVLVIADKKSNPEFIAADLLSQAEHGDDSQVMLVSDDAGIVDAVQAEIQKQLSGLPRKNIAERALENSRSIVFDNLEEAMQFSNQYAPEHLIIATSDADALSEKVVNAGSVFLGEYSCESAGDYASGTNHTLPTSGYADSYSGVSLDSFLKKITFQKLTSQGIRNLGPTIEIMAEAEGLIAHKNAVSVRLKYLENV